MFRKLKEHQKDDRSLPDAPSMSIHKCFSWRYLSLIVLY